MKLKVLTTASVWNSLIAWDDLYMHTKSPLLTMWLPFKDWQPLCWLPFHYDNIYQNLIMCQITNNLIEPPWMLFNLLYFLTAAIVVIAGCRILVENDYLVFMQLCLPNNTPDILIQIKTKSFKWMVLKQHMVCRFSL